MWFSKKKLQGTLKAKNSEKTRVNIRNQTHIAEVMGLLDWEFKTTILNNMLWALMGSVNNTQEQIHYISREKF